MSGVFEKHQDRRISELHERMRNYKLKKKSEIKTSEIKRRKSMEKYQGNKAKLMDLSSITPSLWILNLI